MKKVLLILSATVLLIAGLFMSYKLYDVNRYKLSQSMNDIEYKTAIIKASKNRFYKINISNYFFKYIILFQFPNFLSIHPLIFLEIFELI